MIPSIGVEQKLDGGVDSVPPYKVCEVLDGELTHDIHILLKWEFIVKCCKGSKISKSAI